MVRIPRKGSDLPRGDLSIILGEGNNEKLLKEGTANDILS